ncbi:MAG: FprA family A-type flavoprotein [Chloroflexia bacterium]|nr:FprA family A-type flavoprotein [Chloroflexia bacterium]
MSAIAIKPDIYWVGVNDRTSDLFEGLWPITQEGVSYNAYLVRDERQAIIDLSKAIKGDQFFEQVAAVTDLSALDYIVINHMEPDHSGVLRTLLRIAPQVEILGSEKTKAMLESFYGVTENVRVVEDGETLSLGQHTLQFFSTPFVHWPETMMTYETSRRILFACDAFGSYGALRGAIFDDDCADLDFYEQEALRYYANIVAKFSRMVLRAIDKLADLPVDMIAPSHGLIWRRNPERIVELYRRWAEYATGPTEPGITLLYASMYGNTEKMMNTVAQGISSEGLPLDIFDVHHTHVSYILSSLWTKAGVMIGAPTYEGGLFPYVVHVLDMAKRKGVRGKLLGYFGSYGWSGGAQRELGQWVEDLKWESGPVLDFVGAPTQAELEQGEAFGAAFARSVRERLEQR